MKNSQAKKTYTNSRRFMQEIQKINMQKDKYKILVDSCRAYEKDTYNFLWIHVRDTKITHAKQTRTKNTSTVGDHRWDRSWPLG